jgi:hypothetical protein
VTQSRLKFKLSESRCETRSKVTLREWVEVPERRISVAREELQLISGSSARVVDCSARQLQNRVREQAHR